MFIFEKRTQIPVCIKNRNPHLASIILSQYGGPDGELSASLRYLSQRFTMPDNKGKALLTDIGTEELAHRCCQYIYASCFFSAEKSRMTSSTICQ